MEKFQKISSRIVIALALLLGIAIALGKISVGYSYMGIGLLSTYIGIQNMILLNWGQRTGQMPAKIAFLIERHGNNKGLMQYTLINILMFLLLGLSVAYCGWQLV